MPGVFAPQNLCTYGSLRLACSPAQLLASSLLAIVQVREGSPESLVETGALLSLGALPVSFTVSDDLEGFR